MLSRVMLLAAALLGSAAALLRGHVETARGDQHALELNVTNATGTRMSSRTAVKVRLCNAVTMERGQSLIHLWVNGAEVTAAPLKPRACEEFSVPITSTNDYMVTMSGGITADWSRSYSASALQGLSSLFLVPFVFGDGPIFHVNEYEAVDKGHDGTISAALAFMDLYRGAEHTLLEMQADCTAFRMMSMTVRTGICAADYTMNIVDATNHATPAGSKTMENGEQYLVLRLAPEGTTHFDQSQDALGHILTFP